MFKVSGEDDVKDDDLVFSCGIGDWTLEDIKNGAKSILRMEDQRLIDECLGAMND
jgi:hypothetical protein